MQATQILHKHLSNVMHKTRLITLSLLVGSLFRAKFFSLTGIGGALKTDAQERSAIRRVDTSDSDPIGSLLRSCCSATNISGFILIALVVITW